MKDISNSNFGLLIAYALPGFVVVWAVGGVWPPTHATADAVASIITVFNTTVAAIAAGMVVSAIRFVVIDSLFTALGLRRPPADSTALQQNLGAVTTSIDQHYRYYQFHANMLVAGVIAYAAHRLPFIATPGLPELVLIALAGVFWLTARDNLTKYYRHLSTIRSPYPIEAPTMSNGMHHDPPSTTKPSKGKASETDRSRDKREQSVRSKPKPASNQASAQEG